MRFVLRGDAASEILDDYANHRYKEVAIYILAIALPNLYPAMLQR